MNFLLVMPRKLSKGADTTSVIFPLGIAYVSAALKEAGFKVYTLNLDFPEQEAYPALERAIQTHDIHVVCTGGLSLDYHKVQEVLLAAKSVRKDIITVVGGGMISSDPETAMGVLSCEIGVIGEGERTLCELADALEKGLPLNGVQGLILRNADASLLRTPPRKEIPDIDKIPFPDFDGFNYGEWVRHCGNTGVLLSDRSCPFRCTFCFHPTGEKYRQRSLDNIFAEIDMQIEKYGIQSLGMSSELFATSRERVLEFCDRIEKYGLNWSCCLRVTNAEPELLHRMRQAGCTLICYGLESADDRVLASMQKGITVAQIQHALDLTIETGISTEASNFIFGDINETRETVKNTMDFWWRYNQKTHINLSLIQIYPGTHLYHHACETGLIRDKEQFLKDGCPFINVSKLTDTEYHALKSSIAELRMHPHTLAQHVSLSSIDETGICKADFTCRKCGHVQTTQVPFWMTATCICTQCQTKNEVDSNQGALQNSQELLNAFHRDERVGVWGAGGVFYKLFQKHEERPDQRFLVVDANPDLHGLDICGQRIFAPDALENPSITQIFITAISAKSRIIQEIQTRFSHIQSIILPAYNITPEGIAPSLISTPLPR